MDPYLLEEAKRGEKEAFGKIVDEYHNDVYFFALSITGNVHDALDVCQDSFIKAYRGIGKLKGADKLKSWLFRITANTARDLFRASRSRELLYEDLGSVFTEGSLVDRLDLLSALMRLKSGYRQVLALRYFSDLKISDIAMILKIPENTVKSRLRYALDRIRDEMEEG